MPASPLRRAILAAAALCLAGCGLVEPSEGDMETAVLRVLRPIYGGASTIEYFDKTACHHQWHPGGYFCRFIMSTNTAVGKMNEGTFWYDSGWRVKLGYDPKYPS